MEVCQDGTEDLAMHQERVQQKEQVPRAPSPLSAWKLRHEKPNSSMAFPNPCKVQCESAWQVTTWEFITGPTRLPKSPGKHDPHFRDLADYGPLSS
jgi:hypothetical protein